MLIPLQIVFCLQRWCHNDYSWELCLLFSDYSPKLKDTYYSQIIPGIFCQSLPLPHFLLPPSLSLPPSLPQVGPRDVCGCPLDHLFPTSHRTSPKFCRQPKRTCTRHYSWEKLRRAEVDQEKLNLVRIYIVHCSCTCALGDFHFYI